MDNLIGNKGEWSEIYAFLRLLQIGKLYAADAELNRREEVFLNIINIVRNENVGDLEFRVNRETKRVSVFNASTNKVLIEVATDEFSKVADELYNDIVSATTASFTSHGTELFLSKINVSKIKAKSNDKADIRIRIHDNNTGIEALQGFSIKSRLGSPSTLINAGRTTNFIYEVVGNVSDNVILAFNTENVFRQKMQLLHNSGLMLRFQRMESEVFEGNLRMIDGDLPGICSYMLEVYYSDRVSRVADILNVIRDGNPMNYVMCQGHPFYQYKFKKLLTESALGMLPSKVWNGRADATGGYVIVREDGEVLCYHLFNRNDFEDYLYKNTKFETPSTSRHQFGKIYQEEGKYYLKLNMQIRFTK